jgi:hypothetical protein
VSLHPKPRVTTAADLDMRRAGRQPALLEQRFSQPTVN